MKENSKNYLELDENEKRKAAYALNLCTVSISQIIDYEDLNILEQEYEMILNNLNLENFPKDKPLLHILKQILDTVSFFRIYEGDKRMLDKKYQQDMKNAIWSAIPPFTFVAGGDPYALAVSAIAAVGMGYMNYRKEKAKKTFEKEEDEWKLQRSAIEQFHGLRRELFDTAWRLSEKYGFNDEYRLTEKQISVYNRILMDTIPLRKYERLIAIKEFFIAYPPFWYYLGNAAYDVAKMYKNSEHIDTPDSLGVHERYLSFAVENFKKYLESDHSLFRADYIRSSCCLEYAALLLERNNHTLYGEIKQLIADAEKFSPDTLDVMQICAMYSLRIDDIENAQRLLRKLVIEGFNTTTNAQLLSYVYLNMVLANKKLYNKNTAAYKELILFTDSNVLVPWAEDVSLLDEIGVNNLYSKFLGKQKERIQNQFKAVVDKIVEIHTIEYNKALFKPRNDYYNVDDSFYTDTDLNIEKRKQEYSIISENQTEWSIFVNNLRNKSIALVLNNQLDEVFRLLSLLTTQILKSDIEVIYNIDNFYESFAENNYKVMRDIIEKVDKACIDGNDSNDTFGKEDCNTLLSNSFTSVINNYIIDFKKEVVNRIAKQRSFGELISIECDLADFCSIHGFPSPDELYKENSIRIFKENKRQYVDLLPYFKGAKAIKQNAEIEKEIKNKIEFFINNNKLFNSISNSNNEKDIIFTKNEEKLDEIHTMLSKEDSNYITQLGKILAYFHDNKSRLERYRDLYFLREGFVLVSNATFATKILEYHKFDEIKYDSSKHLIYTDNNAEIYSSDNINVRALYDLIIELRKISSTK